jgi:hypothetical protein
MTFHVDTKALARAGETPIAALRRLRREAAAEVERLIALLDALEGDPDLEEPGDLEPSLGWTATGYLGGDSDREDPSEDEDNHDSELDPAEMGIADSGAADEFMGEHAAIAAFRDDRAIRRTGRRIPEPTWPRCEPRQLDEGFAGMIPQLAIPATSMGMEVGNLPR